MLALVLAATCSVHFGRRIRSMKVPMQWGSNGEPTWFAPRPIGIWWGFGFTLIVGGFMFAMACGLAAENIPSLCLAIAAMSILEVIVQFLHLRAIVRWEAKGNIGA